MRTGRTANRRERPFLTDVTVSQSEDEKTQLHESHEKYRDDSGVKTTTRSVVMVIVEGNYVFKRCAHASLAMPP